MKIMKSAPVGEKYCNGLCQKFISNDCFFDGKANCKSCFYLFKKVKSMVEHGQITYEQFKDNPLSVKVDKTIISITRKCKTCEEDKTLDNFEETRKECIQCRRLKSKKKYDEEIINYITEIEKIKEDINALTHLFRNMSADLLRLTISHYKILVKHEDRKKPQMISKLIDYFNSLINPKVCLGGCGCELTTEFTVCDFCKKKPKKLREHKQVAFEENLDIIVEELKDTMTLSDEFFKKYNKQQLFHIAEKLKIKCYASSKKNVIIDIIKTYFEEKKKNHMLEKDKNFSGELSVNNVIIQSREDGMINATALCKAGGKLFGHWYDLKSTKELIAELEKSEVVITTSQNYVNKSDIVITISQIIDIQKGNSSSIKQGSWVHPDLAVQLAQWISPKFALQVSRWVRELAIAGSVSIGNEKSEEQLVQLQKEYKKLENTHRKLLQKKSYYKFKSGPAFYIISDMDSKSIRYKPGFEGSDISRRLAEHRSSFPACKLEFLVYSDNAKLIETNILTCFESKRTIKNKEWLFDISIETIIRQTRTILNVINIKYTEEENIHAYNDEIEMDVVEK